MSFLARRLRAANPTVVPGPVFVGSAKYAYGGFAGTTYNVDFDTIPLQAGDLVIVVTGWSHNADGNPGVNTAGYTEVADLYANDGRDANLAVAWKIMGATPDTLVNVNANNSTSYSNVTLVHAWRGVDQTTPMESTPTTATGISGASLDGPAISGTNIYSVVLSCVLGTIGNGSGAPPQLSEPVGYSNLEANGARGSAYYGVQAAIAAQKMMSGSFTENPGAWGSWWGLSDPSDSWCAVTLALRPAA